MIFEDNLSLNDFEKFAVNHPLGRFMQTSEQLKVTGRKKEVGCVGVYDDKHHLIAAAHYFIDHSHMGNVYSIKGGPLLDYKDENLLDFFLHSCSEYFKQQGALSFRITPPLDRKEFDEHGNVLVEKNDALIKHMRQLGFRHFSQRPIRDNRLPAVGLGYEYRKDLRKVTSVSELRATYNKRARNDVKRAERFGVYLEKLDYSQLGEFKKYTQRTANERKYPDQSLEFYQQVYRNFGDDVLFVEAKLNLKKFVVKCQKEEQKMTQRINGLEEQLRSRSSKKVKSKLSQAKQQLQQTRRSLKKAQDERKREGDVIILSGGMFYVHPQEMAYMFSFTDKQYSNYYGQHYLMDYIMQLAVKKHIPIYNFYMVTGLFDGTDGVLKFKQLFKGNTYQTIGWFEKPLKPFRYYVNTLIRKALRKEEIR
ncbi:peptidoglycan bridge formation glycyltransferase FemA/FemB family protein [Ligilactobacillus sp. LYQ60]|uniref:peptidoglycan bridge formation glycyltransferase FemA/FemB family protein n=1 Tax=unclassified Ligilactobacillus TaxID=2767920 RepID=UPI003854F20C